MGILSAFCHEILCPVSSKNIRERRSSPLYKSFANLSNAAACTLLGIDLQGRKLVPVKDADNKFHFLSSDIRLYLLLLFSSNSSDGMTDPVSVKESADLLAVNRKTILNACSRLQNAGLIKVTPTSCPDEKIFEVINLGTYTRRGEGGKGYRTLDKAILDKLLQIRNINLLRVIFAALICGEINHLNSAASSMKFTLEYDILKQFFPISSRVSDIRRACDDPAVSGFFEIQDGRHKSRILIKLSDDCDSSGIKQAKYAEAKQKISAAIANLSESIYAANADIKTDRCIHLTSIKGFRQLSQMGFELFDYISPFDQSTPLPLLDINSSEKEDLCRLAVEYEIDLVEKTIGYYYVNYLVRSHFKKDKKTGLGGLMRRILEDMTSSYQQIQAG